MMMAKMPIMVNVLLRSPIVSPAVYVIHILSTRRTRE
jgi:hypothetical protein